MTQNIAIIDYGMGNLRSVAKAFEACGASPLITRQASDLINADKIVLPGVGAFDHCMQNLTATGLINDIKDQIQAGKFFLGICLGMQLLFESSEENGPVDGLGILPGHVLKFNISQGSELKIPHMGWNAIDKMGPATLFKNLPDQSEFYFVHSYYCAPQEPEIISTTTSYDKIFCSSIEKDNIFACQFHPEKSQKVGLTVIQNFLEL